MTASRDRCVRRPKPTASELQIVNWSPKTHRETIGGDQPDLDTVVTIRVGPIRVTVTRRYLMAVFPADSLRRIENRRVFVLVCGLVLK